MPFLNCSIHSKEVNLLGKKFHNLFALAVKALPLTHVIKSFASVFLISTNISFDTTDSKVLFNKLYKRNKSYIHNKSNYRPAPFQLKGKSYNLVNQCMSLLIVFANLLET